MLAIGAHAAKSTGHDKSGWNEYALILLQFGLLYRAAVNQFNVPRVV